MYVTSENNPSGDHDEEKYDNLDRAKEVIEFDTEVRGKCMHARNDDDYRNRDPALSPFSHAVVRRN